MAKQTREDKRKQELIDELIKDYDGPESFWGESGIFADLNIKGTLPNCHLNPSTS